MFVIARPRHVAAVISSVRIVEIASPSALLRAKGYFRLLGAELAMKGS